MTTTTYRIAPAPKFAQFSAWDCTRCGRQEVKPVFLTDGSGASAYGSGCAAVLLGRPRTAARKVVDEFAAIMRREAELESMRVERRESYGRALVAFNARIEGDNADLIRARRTYHQSGGFDAHGPFPAWVARVAESGDIG